MSTDNYSRRIKRTLNRAIHFVRANQGTYLQLNAVYYGTVLISATAAWVFPSLNKMAWAQTNKELDKYGQFVIKAYETSIPLAAFWTFVVNLGVGAFSTITASGYLIPYGGVALSIYRAVIWGFLFSPSDPKFSLSLVPHLLCLVLEGQAYILTLLGSYLQARMWHHPTRYGYQSRSSAYRAGINTSLIVYPLVIANVAVAAIYEAIECRLMELH